MCHSLWTKHTCGHKGSYLRYKHCKYFENTLEILAKVKATNLELRIRMNERSCKLDHTKEEFEWANEPCKLCKAGLPRRTESPSVKAESPEPCEVLRRVSEMSDLSYTQQIS